MAVFRFRKNFLELTQSGIDADANTNSNSLDIAQARNICIDIAAGSGAHTTHVVTLQTSIDDSVWTTSSTTIAQIAFSDNIAVTARYVRLRVTTKEGGASTIDITIQAKV